MIKQHTAHFESMCRHLVRDGGAMAAMHGLQADLLLLDALFSCAFPVSGWPPPAPLPAISSSASHVCSSRCVAV
jgi:hypothetical protein